MDVLEVDHRRLKFIRPRPPQGTTVTDEMFDTALQAVENHSHTQGARYTQSGDILVTTKRIRSASKAIREFEQLAVKICRLIIDTLINESKKAKRKARQANATKRKKSASFLNDKSRTIPVPSPSPTPAA